MEEWKGKWKMEGEEGQKWSLLREPAKVRWGCNVAIPGDWSCTQYTVDNGLTQAFSVEARICCLRGRRGLVCLSSNPGQVQELLSSKLTKLLLTFRLRATGCSSSSVDEPRKVGEDGQLMKPQPTSHSQQAIVMGNKPQSTACL